MNAILWRRRSQILHMLLPLMTKSFSVDVQQNLLPTNIIMCTFLVVAVRKNNSNNNSHLIKVKEVHNTTQRRRYPVIKVIDTISQ